MTMFPDMMAQKGLILKEWLFVAANGDIFGDVGPEYVWTKPPGANFLYFFIQNGGSAGGSGFTRASGVAGGGGGGGGGGASAWFITPSIFLPGQLLIRPSRGGVGGGTKAPTNGGITLLSQPSTTRITITLSTGTFGGDGSGVAGGTGGAGNNVATQLTDSPFFFNSIFQSCPSGVGLAGGNGGMGGGSSAQSGVIGNMLFGSGGGGGAGISTGDASTFAGNGGVPRASGLGTNFFITPLAPGGGSVGDPGEHGTTYWGQTMFPMGATGGAGARAGGTVAGGRGGDGGWGCGGGGGGAGTTGGAGGNGGPGFVYILAW